MDGSSSPRMINSSCGLRQATNATNGGSWSPSWFLFRPHFNKTLVINNSKMRHFTLRLILLYMITICCAIPSDSDSGMMRRSVLITTSQRELTCQFISRSKKGSSAVQESGVMAKCIFWTRAIGSQCNEPPFHSRSDVPSI
jgi:hypothetical protein